MFRLIQRLKPPQLRKRHISNPYVHTRLASNMSVDASTIVTNDSVITSNPPGKVNAVVVLLGWLGATHRPLGKYAEMYQKRGCVTIATTAPAGSVMFPGTSAVRELASSVLNEAASSIIRVEEMADNTKVPLIVHAFSNGGTFVVETIESLIQENSQDVERTVSNPGTVIEKDTKLQESTQLAADRIRIGGQVFDSAPAMMHLQAGVTAIGHAVPGSAILRVGVQAVFGIVAALGVVYARATGAPGRGVVFWDHMQQSNLGCKQYYIYSVDDELTDAKYLDELIAFRKEKGVEITAIRLESSPHVQHLKSHPEVYSKFVDNILEEAGMHASSN